MDRNFFRRVETCFPIENEVLSKTVIEDGLMQYLADNSKAWVMQPDGSYKRLTPGSKKARNAQVLLLEKLAAMS
jgi:polyphosphate kinase